MGEIVNNLETRLLKLNNDCYNAMAEHLKAISTLQVKCLEDKDKSIREFGKQLREIASNTTVPFCMCQLPSSTCIAINQPPTTDAENIQSSELTSVSVNTNSAQSSTNRRTSAAKEKKGRPQIKKQDNLEPVPGTSNSIKTDKRSPRSRSAYTKGSKKMPDSEDTTPVPKQQKHQSNTNNDVEANDNIVVASVPTPDNASAAAEIDGPGECRTCGARVPKLNEHMGTHGIEQDQLERLFE